MQSVHDTVIAITSPLHYRAGPSAVDIDIGTGGISQPGCMVDTLLPVRNTEGRLHFLSCCVSVFQGDRWPVACARNPEFAPVHTCTGLPGQAWSPLIPSKGEKLNKGVGVTLALATRFRENSGLGFGKCVQLCRALTCPPEARNGADIQRISYKSNNFTEPRSHHGNGCVSLTLWPTQSWSHCSEER